MGTGLPNVPSDHNEDMQTMTNSSLGLASVGVSWKVFSPSRLSLLSPSLFLPLAPPLGLLLDLPLDLLFPLWDVAEEAASGANATMG